MVTLNINNSFKELIEWFNVGLGSLKSFQFSIVNPVFWLFAIILFLALLRFWRPKKSFSFCLVISIILLGMTKAESSIVRAVLKHGEVLDPFFLRIAAIFFISIVCLYYWFIKNDD